jgi:predicted transposase YbfD/YdcC
MDDQAHRLMLRIFKDIPDPRMQGKVIHKLHDILVIAVCSIIAGLEHWTQMEDYCKANFNWFKSFLDLPSGIPSHDTFGNVFAALSPDAFEKAIQTWINSLKGSGTKGKHIAIDGKALRGSFDKAAGKTAVYMVNAYVHENHTVFGQVKVADKSNEITAIPDLLEMLELNESTITIDAMGCQRAIAKKIIEKQGHYVLALKGNQGSLLDDVKMFIDDIIANGSKEDYDYFESTEKGHGRIEIRKCWSVGNIEWLTHRHDWAGLTSVVAVESKRIINEKESSERRYFISSHSGRCSRELGRFVRDHWRIENELHWTLDVCFNEDSCRARTQNAAENLARIRRIALMMLKNEKTCKLGVKSKRAKASYDRDYMLTVLGVGHMKK